MGSAATANPFHLLIDDENEDPMIMAAAVPQKVSKPSPAVAAAPAKADKLNAPANSANADTRGEFGRGRGRDSRGGRGGREGGRGGRGDRLERPPRVQEATDDGFEGPGSPTRGNREGGRGSARTGGRGARGRGRGGDGSDRPPRREYERRDGTGRGHEGVKRGGAGRGNWGTEGEQGEGDVPADTEGVAEGGSPSFEGEAPPEEPAPEEPEEKTMSLEEYERIAAEKRAGLNKAVNNQPTADFEAQFKGMSTMTKAKIEEDSALELSRAKGTGARKEKEKKVKDVVTDVGFSVEKQEERFRGGRGEGRGRGGRDRGEGRSGRGRGEARGEGRGGRGGRGGNPPSFNVEDTSAFPTLEKK